MTKNTKAKRNKTPPSRAKPYSNTTKKPQSSKKPSKANEETKGLAKPKDSQSKITNDSKLTQAGKAKDSPSEKAIDNKPTKEVDEYEKNLLVHFMTMFELFYEVINDFEKSPTFDQWKKSEEEIDIIFNEVSEITKILGLNIINPFVEDMLIKGLSFLESEPQDPQMASLGSNLSQLGISPSPLESLTSRIDQLAIKSESRSEIARNLTALVDSMTLSEKNKFTH
jgi:hypothetical protein